MADMGMNDLKKRAAPLRLDVNSINLLPQGTDIGVIRPQHEPEDQGVLMLLSQQECEKRSILDDWDKWVSKWKRAHQEEKSEAQKIMYGKAREEEKEDELIVVELEELLEVLEQVLSSARKKRKMN